MFSLSQVLSPGFARSWHEAVAIVQEVAAQIQPGLELPGPEDLTIDENGVLTLGFGDEGSGDPVAALAGLLESLLEGVEAPQALRDLARENAGPSPAHATIASFSQALAFFERPNRANDIRAVAGRLRHVRQKSETELELERLREKVAHAGEPDGSAEAQKKKKKKPDQRKKKPQLTKAQQIAVVAAVALMVFGTLGYQSGLHQNLGAATGGVESGIQTVVSAALEFFGISKAAASTPEPGDVPVEAADGAAANENGGDRPVRASRTGRPERPSRPARRDSPAARSSAGSNSAAAADAAAAPTRSRAAAASEWAARTDPPAEPAREPAPPEPEPREPMPAVTPMPPPGAVFTAEDPEVEAPVLLRPQLPKEPAPGDDTGIFDILVDEHGNVEEIKLISPRRRFQERMLVAAAKAWKFRPATLHGYPVKYRIRIPIIIKGMP